METTQTQIIKPAFRYLATTVAAPKELDYLARIIYSLLYQGFGVNEIEAQQGINRRTSRRVIRDVLLPLGLVSKSGARWKAAEPPLDWFTYTRGRKPAYIRVVAIKQRAGSRGKLWKWPNRLLYSYLFSQAQQRNAFYITWRQPGYYAKALGFNRRTIRRASAKMIGRKILEAEEGKVILPVLRQRYGERADIVLQWCELMGCQNLYQQVMELSAGWSLAKVAEKLVWVGKNYDSAKYPSPLGLLKGVFPGGSK